MKIPRKARTFKGKKGYVSAFKKFIVRLQPGDTIDAFQTETA